MISKAGLNRLKLYVSDCVYVRVGRGGPEPCRYPNCHCRISGGCALAVQVAHKLAPPSHWINPLINEVKVNLLGNRTGSNKLDNYIVCLGAFTCPGRCDTWLDSDGLLCSSLATQPSLFPPSDRRGHDNRAYG